ncbi:hypothetical protein [Micromonospora sp. NPDC050495]|uniref:golvesin C-terminal-like domain-containing protein n=1 Tax=Micromonospora sp. NPDC050495 TaxID=3154936 RepID=UPI0033DA72E5
MLSTTLRRTLALAVLATALVAPQLARAQDRAPATVGASIAAGDRDAVLGRGWRGSTDRAWTTTGDAAGLHILVADARDGYAWRTAATLAEPGFETDRWVGNACLTGSGRRVVAVYAPRTFTNHEQLGARGGFTAVVDLDTGAVRRLPVTSSLAYFNPGCGAGETAALTQEGDEQRPGTRLVRVDAGTGRAAPPVRLTGQVTSAVPTGDGFTAARGRGLIRVSATGRATALTGAAGVPFGLTVDGDGGVSYLARTASGMAARRVAGGRDTLLAQGGFGAFGLARGSAGRVFLTGAPASVAVLPARLSRVAADPRADLSTGGQLAVEPQLTAAEALPSGTARDGTAGVRLAGRATATGRTAAFRVPTAPAVTAPAAPAAAGTTKAAPAAAAAATTTAALAAGSSTDPSDPEGYCSIPRNQTGTMAYQPRPRQVEWAVDYAVFKGLTQLRPAGYRKFGLPAYAPQAMFPPRDLVGAVPGRDHVAAQIMLGILTQESNLWQASQADSGEYGNPLIGNYYGRHYYDANTADDWRINWADADCGYGIGQVTDGMRAAAHPKPGEHIRQPTEQRAIALDYAANIAAGLQILQDKWNETMSAGLVVHNGDPTRIENWFFAVWAYNSGFHPDLHDGSSWGVGWGNNPANPRYDPTRHPFLDVKDPRKTDDNVPVFTDAAHPQDWPYQEKVIGWAAASIDTGDDGAGYRIAYWNGDTLTSRLRRSAASGFAEVPGVGFRPRPELFCDATNSCSPGARVQPDEPGLEGEKPGPCLHRNIYGQYDLKCWYHAPVQWKTDCPDSCGYEGIRYDLSVGYTEPTDGTHWPPQCTTSSLPAGAVIVDDLPAGTVTPRCPYASSTGGSFGLEFSGVAAGEYTSKIDFHQLDSGYGGHMWFARARGGDQFRVVGTWRTPVEWTGQLTVYAYVPPHGAKTRNAVYQIRSVDNRIRLVTVDQSTFAGRWVNLGRFQTAAGLTVRLDNTLSDSTEASVGYDAMAFVRG